MNRTATQEREHKEPQTVLDLPRALEEISLDPHTRELIELRKRYLPWFSWAQSTTAL